MAEKQSSPVTSRLDEIALELFKARSLGGLHSETTRAIAVACYRDAQVFLDAQSQITSGQFDPFAEERNPLDPAFAPNLPKNSPWNLMSRQYGSLSRVCQVLKDLEAQPSLTTYERDGLNWDAAQTRAARDLFPGVRQRAFDMGVLN